MQPYFHVKKGLTDFRACPLASGDTSDVTDMTNVAYVIVISSYRNTLLYSVNKIAEQAHRI